MLVKPAFHAEDSVHWVNLFQGRHLKASEHHDIDAASIRDMLTVFSNTSDYQPLHSLIILVLFYTFG